MLDSAQMQHGRYQQLAISSCQHAVYRVYRFEMSSRHSPERARAKPQRPIDGGTLHMAGRGLKILANRQRPANSRQKAVQIQHVM